MAQIPDLKFSVRATEGSLERLQNAIQNAKTKARELDSAVQMVNDSLEDVQFIVERSKPEETDAGDKNTP